MHGTAVRIAELPEEPADGAGPASASADAAMDRACRDVPGLLKANINPVSLLATDYLNHFNEAVMLLELIPDMPDMLGDAKRWAPKDYKRHFRDSGFMAKDLVCAAYDRSPERFRIPFDLAVRTINRRILGALVDIEATLAMTNAAQLDGIVEAHCSRIKHLITTAGALVNGGGGDAHAHAHDHGAHAAAEAAQAAPEPAETVQTLSQDDIDALFR